MRAAFLKGQKLLENKTLEIEGPKLHHLLNVVRVKKGQRILLLNGEGVKAESTIVSINRKTMQIKVEVVTKIEKSGNIDIAFALPKKDAFEFCLRACVETGAEKVFVLKSERAQNYPIKEERVEKIFIAGVEQSNNAFMPQWSALTPAELPLQDYDYAALASLKANTSRSAATGKGILIIGPEGGFTQEEEGRFLANGCFPIHFKGPILRAQTAIPFFAGALSVGKSLSIDG